ncbi:hypothetical protein [Nonomuraea dietziae]|uniref:hypothetical protein n=1 Tax=Nonomuraea dietziae TaxID=65515 RepID=UPI0031D163B3
MRRPGCGGLFAEADSVADPLLHELRHCADVATERVSRWNWTPAASGPVAARGRTARPHTRRC